MSSEPECPKGGDCPYPPTCAGLGHCELEEPVAAYNRRYVVVSPDNRDILDTKFCSITQLHSGDMNIEELRRRLIITRYPSEQAAREAEASLNLHSLSEPVKE